jgi:hypothetical protein
MQAEREPAREGGNEVSSERLCVLGVQDCEASCMDWSSANRTHSMWCQCQCGHAQHGTSTWCCGPCLLMQHVWEGPCYYYIMSIWHRLVPNSATCITTSPGGPMEQQ